MINENENKRSIKNCKLKYECPLIWDNLKETSDPKVRFCDKCKENVVHVQNDEELSKCTSKCVMFQVDIEDTVSPASIPPKEEVKVEPTRRRRSAERGDRRRHQVMGLMS